MSSIAFKYGLHWKTVWDDPANAELRDHRKDPNVLQPGDVLIVPALRPEIVSAATEQRHVFRRLGVPERIRIRLLDTDGKPRKALKYELVIDGRSTRGRTDGDGRLDHAIPANATSGHLIVRPKNGSEERYELRLGSLDPLTTVAGLQGRLNNLGFDCGSPDGEVGPRTRIAIERYQDRHRLPVTGEFDDETRRHLRDAHGF